MWTIGTVPYLNAVPLTAGLERDTRVVADVPAALARRLKDGEFDAAMIPVAEAIRGAGEGYLGGYGIGSEGAVASVLLFLKKPLADVRTVLLDPASRTSAALTRHLVGPDAAYREAPAGAALDPASAAEDAVLVIGDPALKTARRWRGIVLDLGTEWTRRTGLPFVFARWTARRGLPPEERAHLAARLDAAADEGLPRRADLARAFAAARGEDPARAEQYVQRHVRYRIGPREEEGLAHFTSIVKALDGARPEETRRA